jgi:hypothetical protein
MRKVTRFVFNKIHGTVDAYDFVYWGGMCFELGAANAELRAAIAEARAVQS